MSDFIDAKAEQAVLYCCLMSARCVTAAVSGLTAEDFGNANYSMIFKAIEALNASGKTVDMMTIDTMNGRMFPNEQSNLLNVLIDCSKSFAISSNSDEYISIVKELSSRRKSIRTLEESLLALRDPQREYGEVMDSIRSETKDAGAVRKEAMTMSEMLMNAYSYLERRSKGEEQPIESGIPSVDSLIGGFFGGEMTVIGARPAVGKSAFGASVALNAASKGKNVLLCSREMSDVQFGQRFIANVSKIDGMKLRRADLSDDDWMAITEGLSVLSEYPLDFEFNVSAVEDIRRICQKRHDEKRLDMLVVDYMQIMHTRKKFDAEHLRVGYISRTLKEIALDLHIPVVVLAQVNREAESAMPTLKSLRASGDIEQDADGVIFLHRPETIDDSSIDPRDRQYWDGYRKSGMQYLCIGVAKQRQGVTGKTCVLFDAAHMSYYGIERG